MEQDTHLVGTQYNTIIVSPTSFLHTLLTVPSLSTSIVNLFRRLHSDANSYEHDSQEDSPFYLPGENQSVYRGNVCADLENVGSQRLCVAGQLFRLVVVPHKVLGHG